MDPGFAHRFWTRPEKLPTIKAANSRGDTVEDATDRMPGKRDVRPFPTLPERPEMPRLAMSTSATRIQQCLKDSVSGDSMSGYVRRLLESPCPEILAMVGAKYNVQIRLAPVPGLSETSACFPKLPERWLHRIWMQ